MATRVHGDCWYDLEAIEAATTLSAAHAATAVPPVQPTRPLVDEDDIPLTWDPVPVPRPTYTLKARATRPAPAAAHLVGDADTEYAAHADDLPAVRSPAPDDPTGGAKSRKNHPLTQCARGVTATDELTTPP